MPTGVNSDTTDFKANIGMGSRVRSGEGTISPSRVQLRVGVGPKDGPSWVSVRLERGI